MVGWFSDTWLERFRRLEDNTDILLLSLLFILHILLASHVYSGESFNQKFNVPTVATGPLASTASWSGRTLTIGGLLGTLPLSSPSETPKLIDVTAYNQTLQALSNVLFVVQQTTRCCGWLQRMFNTNELSMFDHCVGYLAFAYHNQQQNILSAWYDFFQNGKVLPPAKSVKPTNSSAPMFPSRVVSHVTELAMPDAAIEFVCTLNIPVYCDPT